MEVQVRILLTTPMITKLEDKYWMWLVKGLNGLVNLIRGPIELGEKPCEPFWIYLKQEHAHLTKLLADHDRSPESDDGKSS